MSDDTTATEWTDDPDEATTSQDLIKKDPDGTCNGRTRRGTYCGQVEGWGVDGKSSGRCKNHGGAGGAPSGPANGNWKNGLYSEHFSEADEQQAQQWVELADGDRLDLDVFSRMFEKMLLYEFTRLERAMAQAPDPDLSRKWAHRECGAQLASDQQEFCPACETPLTPDAVIPTQEWVEMHDRSVSERAESLADMIETYKEVTEGSELNIHGHVDVDFETALRRAKEMATDKDGESAAETSLEYLRGDE